MSALKKIRKKWWYKFIFKHIGYVDLIDDEVYIEHLFRGGWIDITLFREIYKPCSTSIEVD